MRVIRRKNIKRHLTFFRVNFDVREPYRVIHTTECIMQEVRRLPNGLLVFTAAKRFRRYPCVHSGEMPGTVTSENDIKAKEGKTDYGDSNISDIKNKLIYDTNRKDFCEGADDNVEDEDAFLRIEHEAHESTDGNNEDSEIEGEGDGCTENGVDLHETETQCDIGSIENAGDLETGAEKDASPNKIRKFEYHPALQGRLETFDINAIPKKRQAEELDEESFLHSASASSRLSSRNNNTLILDAYGCICDMAKQQAKNRIIVATQDARLRQRLRLIAGIPILFVHGGGLEFDRVNDASLRKVQRGQEEKMSVSAAEKMKLEDGTNSHSQESQKKKRKKGANPLSCKRSTKVITKTPKQAVKKCRSRKKKVNSVQNDKTDV